MADREIERHICKTLIVSASLTHLTILLLCSLFVPSICETFFYNFASACRARGEGKTQHRFTSFQILYLDIVAALLYLHAKLRSFPNLTEEDTVAMHPAFLSL
jgi:hypothetical protein